MIINAESIYTGGNIWCFTGGLDDGTYFLADDCFYDVRIIDVNPDEYDADEEVWQADWQATHLVRDLDEEESLDFFEEMILWFRLAKPHDTYVYYSRDALEDIRGRRKNG